MSFGYDRNNGLVKKTSYDRYNVSAKMDMQPNKRVKLGVSLDMSMQKANDSAAGIDRLSMPTLPTPTNAPTTTTARMRQTAPTTT